MEELILEMPCFVDGKCPECKSESKEILYLKKKDDKVNNEILDELENNNLKIIPESKIKNCSECPHCDYDGHYSMSTDSGYDCKLSGKRIIDDYEWDNTNNPKRLNKKLSGIPTPKWCELKSTGEEK